MSAAGDNLSQDVPEGDIGPNRDWISSKLNLALQDSYACKQAINLWQGPRYLDYNSLIERVRSSENFDWPEHNPSPVAMVEAGFFYNSKYNTVFFIFL